MLKVATSRAMPANAERKTVKKLSPCWMSSWFSLVSSAPVMASTSGGSSRSMRDTSSVSDTPESATAAMASSFSGWAM